MNHQLVHACFLDLCHHPWCGPQTTSLCPLPLARPKIVHSGEERFAGNLSGDRHQGGAKRSKNVMKCKI